MSNIQIQGSSPGIQITVLERQPIQLPAEALARHSQPVDSSLSQNPTPNTVIVANNTAD